MKYNEMVDCPKVPITELLSFIVDNRGKTVPTSESGHILIATNCIKNDALYPVYEKVRYLDDHTYQTWFRAHPEPGDIIFVNKGSPGRVCMVPDKVDFCIAQDMMAFRVNEKAYNKYLFAVLRSPSMQKIIENSHVGTLIPHFKKNHLHQLLIPLPSKDTQISIGDLYFSLSRKIELNNKINANLEAQAQAIFKSWFVDFEPFQDGEFVDSELGRIPKGWRVGKFTDIVNVLGGGTPKTDNATYWNGEIPFFTPKDVSGVYAMTTEKCLTVDGIQNCNSPLYPVNTTFITARGTVGKIALAGVAMAMNQSCYALQSKSDGQQFFVYGMANQVVKSLRHKSSGAIFNAIVTRDFSSEYIVIPNDNIINDFQNTVSAFYDLILHRTKQNQTLVSLRDTLLPKLMSGEIEVPTAEAIIQERS